MIALIRKLLNTFFLIFFLLLSAPTLLFLTKWYYANLVANKTYIGLIELPRIIESSNESVSAAKTLFSSPDIKGIIINCDGEGGNPGVCHGIYADIVKLKKLYKKPIIAYIEKESLAGSYLIATAADYIISTEGAMIGNLGIFLQSDTLPLELLKSEYYSQYSKIVIASRPQVEKATIELCHHTPVTGYQLIKLGLVDFIGGTLEVERILKTKTVIEGSIEKVRGSFFEHCYLYIVDLITRTINTFKSK